MKRMRKVYIFIAVLVLIGCLVPSAALASLTVGYVGGKGLNPEVTPGENYTQTLLVGLGKDDAATDVLIEVLGYGNNASGDVVPVPAEADISSYSARSFIQPARTTVHVEPGETKQADFTVTIPENVGSGGRYAILRFSTAPTGEGTVGIISAIVLPVRFTISGSQLIHTGKVTGVSTGKAESGQPIDIFTQFQNTGNHHFTIKGQIEIRDAGGKLIDTLHITDSSPIPGDTKNIKTTYIPASALPLGIYSVKSTLTLEDGTSLGEASGSFEVAAPYVPPPPASVTLNPGNASVLETADKAISISFPKGAVTGQVDVSLRSYPAAQLPSPPANYTAATTCFRVDGLTGLLAQNATVTVRYTGADLDKAKGDASRLTLARWDEAANQWSVLKTKVDTGAMTLTAHTNRFSIWAVMVSPSAKTNWPLIGGAIAAGIIIIAALVAVLTRKKKVRQ
jgi:hypothetical protein